MKNFKFKLPSAFVIILSIMAFIAFLSWFVGGSFVDGNGAEYNQAAQVGLITSTFIYPIQGFLDASDLIMFLFAIGGFIGIMMETESMEAGMVALVKKLKGKEIWAIIPLMILFSFGGTTYGMAEETIAFYPIIVPLFILAGFDPLTGFMVLALGAGTGVAASTVNPFAVGAAAGAAGVSMGEGAAFRWFGWIIMTALAIGFVFWYAAKTKKDPSKTNLAEADVQHLVSDAKSKFSIEEAPAFTARKKLGLTIFGIMFMVMVISVIPWEAFNESAYDEWDGPITMFYDFGTFLNDKLFILFGGTMDNAFYIGGMYFAELAAFFFMGFIILAVLFKKGEAGTINSFMVGAKDMFSVGMIIAVSRGLSILLGDTGFTLRILNGVGDSMKSMGVIGFIVVTFILMIFLSFLIPSTSGLAAAAFGVMGPLAFIVGGGEGTTEGAAVAAMAVTAFVLASGIVNLFTPTSGIIMGALETTGMKYGAYVKTIAPYIAVLTTASLLFLIVGAAMI